MPTYSYAYKILHDIEWFFQCDGWPIHAVSNAGYIPRKIDRDENVQVQYATEEMRDVYEYPGEVYVNEAYVRYRLSLQQNRREGAFEDYIRGFVRMAKKGFCSFDRDITLGWDSKRYVLIAAPLQKTALEIGLTELTDGVDVSFFQEPVVYNDRPHVNWYFE